MSDLKVNVESINPGQAQALLESLYERQRPVKKRAVDRYVADMKAGRWQPDSSIKIDQAGHLVDGQHRLLAVVKSGMTVEFIVIRGVATVSYVTTDTGAGRTLADVLRFQGEVNTTVLAAGLSATITFLVRGVFAEGGAGNYASRQQALELLDADPGIKEWVTPARHLGNRLKFPPGILTGFGYVANLSGASAGKVGWFMDQVTTGAGLQLESPALIARQVLERRRNTPAMRRYNTAYYMNQFMQAWNAYAKGSPTLTLRPVSTDKPPQLFDPDGRIEEWRDERKGRLGINGTTTAGTHEPVS